MAKKKQTIAACFSRAADRKLVTGHLSGLGHKLVEFQDKTGIPADLFILDIPSAGRIGPQVLSLKKAENIFLPMMVVLGKNDAIDPWLAAGFDDYLQEPFTKAQFKAKVALLLHLRQQAQELVLISEARYQAIFKATGTATLIVEEDTTIVLANTECLRVTGYRAEELIGSKWTGYVTPESLEIMLKYHMARRANPGKAPDQYEAKLVNKAGQVRDVLLTISMVTGTKQSVVSLLDISETKQAVEALRKSEARYRALAEAAPDMIFVIDRDDRVQYINSFAARQFGATSEQMIGKRRADLFPPDIAERQGLALRRVFDDGQPLFSESPLRIGGRQMWISNWLVPLRDGAETVTAVMGISRDITKRKRSEDALRVSETRFRSLSAQFTALLDAIPDSLILHSPELKVLWANNSAAAQMGKDMLDIVGNYCYALFHDRTTACEPCPVLKSFRTGKQESATITAPNALLLELRTIPIIEDGRVINVIEVSRDITEHRKLEDQLRQGQKMEAIGRLAGGVAHDFNNMLNVILGYGELVLGKLDDGHALREEVEEIIKAAERSAALTRQLLAFSRKQPLQPAVLDLNSLLQNLDKMLRRLIGEDIDLKLVFSKDLGRVRTDPAQIEQVIMNLAINAHDAMSSGGMLTIETSNVELDGRYSQTHEEVKPGPYVMLSVSDNGCGMDEDTMSKVFDPFFTTKEKGKGTGLGLATVYGIVKQSGGNISVTSEKGRGTTFQIYLPRTNDELNRKEVRPMEGVRRGDGKEILIVEDEVSLRGLFMTLLTDLDYHVTLAANGSEALQLVNERGLKPDLVITDVVMPGMNVEEMVKHLRMNQPGIKVLYMSGYTNNTIEDHGVIDPDKPFIQKPFTINAIITKIEQLVHGED